MTIILALALGFVCGLVVGCALMWAITDDGKADHHDPEEVTF